MFRPLLRAIPDAHGNAEEVCHSVRQFQLTALFHDSLLLIPITVFKEVSGRRFALDFTH
jgi:hypothetical protein